jgi:hypothetical protein
MTNFAIYRTEKLSKQGSISASAGHMMRTRATPNADPDRLSKNVILIGSKDPVGDVSNLLPEEGERDAEGKLRRRKNSVLAVEVLLTASPEWWQKATKDQKTDWVRSSVAWLAEEYGKANIAHLQLHQDEKTPHLTGFVVPLDPETDRLNARRWLGGAKRLSQQQTDYHAAVKHLGLERGIEGSIADHERVKRHYAQINKNAKPVSVEPPSLKDMFNPQAYADKTAKKARRDMSPIVERAKVTASAKTKAKAAEATARKLENRAKRAEDELEKVKSIADEMRSLPLEMVLEALGLDHSPATGKWKSDKHSIGLKAGNNGKTLWYDFKASKMKGKSGAIDLVMHTMDCDFSQALSWLADRFGPGAAEADLVSRLKEQAKRDVSKAVKDVPPFKAPDPVEANWTHVRKWLIEERGLDPKVVDEAHRLGDIYADDRRNAVFIARDSAGTAVGAELKGTMPRRPFTGMAPGSSKAKGNFTVGPIRAKVVYLVESAIDALSLLILRRKAGENDCAVVSTAGTAPEVPQRARFRGEEVVCAYDADKQGDKAAKSLKLPRMRPTRGKDWNDQLRHGDDPGDRGHTISHGPSL